MRFGIPICIQEKEANKKSKIEIPIDYDAYVLSLIKTGLSATNPDLFKDMYGKPTQKCYSTSLFFPNATFNQDSIVLNEDGEMKLFFSTENMNLAINYYNAFIHLNHLNAEKLPFGHKYFADVRKLYTVPLPKITKNKVLFKTMSPIVLRNSDGRFISCPSDATKEKIAEFNKSLRRNTFNKLQNNAQLASTVKTLIFKPIKARKTVRKSFGLNIECTKGIFELAGNPTLLNYVQESGLGEKTGTFSGMINLVNYR